MKAKPGCRIACLTRSRNCLGSPLKPRATKVAPLTIAETNGLIGGSVLPKGVDLVRMPMPLVGEIWPVVRP